MNHNGTCLYFICDCIGMMYMYNNYSPSVFPLYGLSFQIFPLLVLATTVITGVVFSFAVGQCTITTTSFLIYLIYGKLYLFMQCAVCGHLAWSYMLIWYTSGNIMRYILISKFTLFLLIQLIYINKCKSGELLPEF